MSDKQFELTRRKALLGLGGIGAGAALGGAGTMAFLNDPEHIKNNTVTAGNLDLKLDWFTDYHGPNGLEYGINYPPTNDDKFPKKPMINLGDVKPGDYGCVVVSFHVYDNPAYIWFRPNNVSSKENEMNVPEREAEGDLKGRGELEKYIKFCAFPLGCFDTDNDVSSESMVKQMDDAPVNLDAFTTDEAVAQSGDKQLCLAKGTLDEFYHDTKNGVKVPMWDREKENSPTSSRRRTSASSRFAGNSPSRLETSSRVTRSNLILTSTPSSTGTTTAR
ncbi:SipW-dependent-type signal peptide-containing protein [Haladaptatus sp. NG-SE-30]